MCCSVLHCVAVCCSVLQCVAVCGSAIWYLRIHTLNMVIVTIMAPKSATRGPVCAHACVCVCVCVCAGVLSCCQWKPHERILRAHTSCINCHLLWIGSVIILIRYYYQDTPSIIYCSCYHSYLFFWHTAYLSIVSLDLLLVFSSAVRFASHSDNTNKRSTLTKDDFILIYSYSQAHRWYVGKRKIPCRRGIPRKACRLDMITCHVFLLWGGFDW